FECFCLHSPEQREPPLTLIVHRQSIIDRGGQDSRVWTIERTMKSADHIFAFAIVFKHTVATEIQCAFILVRECTLNGTMAIAFRQCLRISTDFLDRSPSLIG